MRFVTMSLLVPVMLAAGLSAPVFAEIWPAWASKAALETCVSCHEAEDALVILDEWTIKVAGGMRSGKRRRLVHVYGYDGLDQATLYLPSDSFSSYTKIEAWVRDSSGEVRAFSEEDGSLFGAADHRTFDDNEMMVFEPPGLRPGSMVAVECEFRREADRPQDLFQVQQASPVARFRVTVDARRGWQVLSRVTQGRNPGPEHTAAEGAWEFVDVPGRPRADEPYAPRPPRMKLALEYVSPEGKPTFASWSTTAGWLRKLFELPSGSQPHLESALGRLRGSKDNVVEEVGRVARELRYFAIELGWGGFVPRPPETTLQRAFGDCKDKTQVMIALLNRLGVDAVPVLVIAPTDGYVADDLPSPFVFNHVVAGIPWTGRERQAGMSVIEETPLGPLRLYDATLPDASAQDISVGLEGGAALILGDGTQSLMRIPGSSFADNEYATETRVGLHEDGGLDVSTTVRLRGVMRRLLEGSERDTVDPAELREIVYSNLAAIHPELRDLTVGSVVRDDDGSWSYEVRYVSPRGLAEFGGPKLFELNAIFRPSSIPIPEDEPAFLSLQGSIRHTYRIDLAGWKVVGETEPFDLSNTVGRAALNVSSQPDRIVLEQTFELKTSELAVDQREEALRLREALRRVNEGGVVLERNGES